MVGGLFKQEKSLSELEEETEKKEAENRLAATEVSLAEKKVMIAQLKEKGLSPKFFNFDWARIKSWLRGH